MCPECFLSIALLIPGAVSTGGVTLAAVSIWRRQKTAARMAARRKAAEAGSPLSGFAAASPKNRKEQRT